MPGQTGQIITNKYADKLTAENASMCADKFTGLLVFISIAGVPCLLAMFVCLEQKTTNMYLYGQLRHRHYCVVVIGAEFTHSPLPKTKSCTWPN